MRTVVKKSNRSILRYETLVDGARSGDYNGASFSFPYLRFMEHMHHGTDTSVTPSPGLRLRLPATMEDAQALLRITALGTHVRSVRGEEVLVRIPEGGEKVYGQIHARVMQLMAETEQRLGRSVLNDGNDVQVSHELRLAFSARLKSLGLGVEVEDEAGVRSIRPEPGQDRPFASGVASPKDWKAFEKLWGLNLSSRSGR